LVVSLGCEQKRAALKQRVRVVEVDPRKTDAQDNPELLLLATSRLKLDGELMALGYRHLSSTCPNGVRIQVYLAIIASLLISLWTGRKATKRTFEMICHYFNGAKHYCRESVLLSRAGRDSALDPLFRLPATKSNSELVIFVVGIRLSCGALIRGETVIRLLPCVWLGASFQ
jgi:hypothetical protein